VKDFSFMSDHDRQPDWEYLMLADAFLEGVKRHDAEYQRFQVAPSVLKEASEVIQAKMREVKGIVDRSDLMWSPQAMEAAVGKEGEEGDPEAIAELAARSVKLYEDVLAWAVELRDRDVPAPIHLLYLTLALMQAKPLREIREFAEQFDRDVHDVVTELRAGRESSPLVAVLKLSMDPEANQALDSVMNWLLASIEPGK
jgi:hypothetical protein